MKTPTCPETSCLPSDFPSARLLRPELTSAKWLAKFSKSCEIVLTASHSCYANVVLDYQDTHSQYISYRLFRDYCVATEEGMYIKDMRIFTNRNLKDMVIGDNIMYSFGYQLENGIPIVPFYYNKMSITKKEKERIAGGYKESLRILRLKRSQNNKTNMVIICKTFSINMKEKNVNC